MDKAFQWQFHIKWHRLNGNDFVQNLILSMNDFKIKLSFQKALQIKLEKHTRYRFF